MLFASRMYCKEKESLAIQAVADYLLGVSLVLGPGVSSNLLRLLVCLLLLIGRLLVGRPLWLLRLLEGLLLEGGLLVGWLDGLLGSWLVVSLLSAWLLLLLIGRGRPLLLNLQDVADNVALDHADADNDAAAGAHLLEVLEATLLRSSSCWPCPWLLLSHSDHLQQNQGLFFDGQQILHQYHQLDRDLPRRLWQRVGAWLLHSLLRCLLPLPQLVVNGRVEQTNKEIKEHRVIPPGI